MSTGEHALDCHGIDRLAALFRDRLFPAIAGMETHGLALPDHLLSAPKERSVVIWQRHPGLPAPQIQPRSGWGTRWSPLLGTCRHAMLRSSSSTPAIGSSSSARSRTRRRGGLVVHRTGGNEIFKAPHSDRGAVLDQRQRFWVDAINRDVDVLVSNSAFGTPRLAGLGVDPDPICQVSRAFPTQRCAAAARQRSKHRQRTFGTSGTGALRHDLLPPRRLQGIDAVIEAVGVARSHDVSLAVVGGGPLLAHLAAVAAASLRPGSHQFLGSRPPEDCPSVIAASDVYLGQHSELIGRRPKGYYLRTETMGRSFCDAPAWRTRVVGTSAGGLLELVADWNGALVDAGDTEHAAAEILRQAGLGRIGPEKVRHFRSRFSWQAKFRRYRQSFGL